jgi:hypothetical protein
LDCADGGSIVEEEMRETEEVRVEKSESMITAVQREESRHLTEAMVQYNMGTPLPHYFLGSQFRGAAKGGG